MTTRRPSTRIRHDPATAAAVMEKPEALHVVRPLPLTGLEGAYRVHVLPESLDQARLKLGDLCEISSEDGSTGYGIAWRADDRMGSRPKNRPVKMTEIVRSAFAFQEGSRVTVQSTTTRIHHADKIIMSDITPAEFGKPEDLEDGCWKAHIIGLFGNCEALTPGISFDLSNRRKMRKRYYIEHIESASISPSAPGLFKYSDATNLVFTAENAEPGAFGEPNTQLDGSTTTAAHLQLDTDGIGGLTEVCRALNTSLKRVLDPAGYNRYSGMARNRPILLHGFEGTGKTTLLDRLARAPFRKVIHLNRETLNTGTITRNKAIIQSTFQDAMANQPSLIVMDDLEDLVPTDDTAYARAITTELKTILSTRVMVVGATRSPAKLHQLMHAIYAFANSIELPIPDLTAREEIFNVLRGKPANACDPLSAAVASQTYGFTCGDLEMLYEFSEGVACDRLDREWEELGMTQTRPRSSPSPSQSPRQTQPLRPSPPRRSSPTKLTPPQAPQSPQSPAPPRYSQLSDFLGSPKSFLASANETFDDTLRYGAHIDSTIIPKAELTLADVKLALPRVKPAALREIHTERPKVRWSDIGGSNGVKETFDEIISWPREHRASVTKFNMQPMKGVLLYGPPGCSKTLTAQAIANTHNFNFIAVKGAELISMYVGESERSIREIFRKARAATPCVVFFDEIDAIGGDRDGDGSTKGLNVLTTLLNEMDGFETLENVVILAATNRPESLDPAIMRPGRFDSHVYIGLPSDVARREIFAITMRNVPIGNDVDFDALVRATEGYSGAEIVRISNAAKTPAVRRDIQAGPLSDTRITAADFREAIASTKMGITREMLEAYEAFGKRYER